MHLRFLLTLGALLVAGAPGHLRAADAPRPNIVFLLADDLGWSGLHCFGSAFYETPNLDRLASQGMRFDHAYANMMNCAPSRASIMSGQYVGRHPVLYVSHYQNRWKKTHGDLKPFRLLQPDYQPSLPATTLTVAESLKLAGIPPPCSASGTSARGINTPPGAASMSRSKAPANTSASRRTPNSSTTPGSI